jgi:CheY-like chemotaxis protein
LPGLGGIEVCNQIREQSDVPIIVLSAREDEDLKVRALDAGADDYVTKPFSHEELLGACAPSCGVPDRRKPTSPLKSVFEISRSTYRAGGLCRRRGYAPDSH